MLFEYASDVHGVFSQSGYLTDQRNYFYIRGTEGVLEITRSGLTIVDNDGNERAMPLDTSGGAHEMWQAIAQAVAAGEDSPYTAELAAKDVCILHAVDRALSLGQKQEILPSLYRSTWLRGGPGRPGPPHGRQSQPSFPRCPCVP
jgi:hypothetical protein